MAKLTFLDLARRVLTEEKRPLSPSEIWRMARDKGYTPDLESEGKIPEKTLYAALFTDARDNPDSAFIKIGERPARYFLKGVAPQSDQPIEYIPQFRESELHPFLTYFSRIHFKAYTKTIDHSTSPKKGFGEWLHPDMVGVYYPLEDWKSEVLELCTSTGGIPVRLFSFEIKKHLSFSNLKEAFFQAVSNSSWAHEGYLVAADITADGDFRAELRRLSTSFGIGVIQLAVEDPDSSEVLAPARERDSLDWDIVNKLTMNRDFRELLIRIKNDLQSKEIIKEKYDPIPTREELLERIRRK